jgi:putative transposase
MSKDRRLLVVNGIYHVMARGNRKGNVFEDGKDRRRFIQILRDGADQYGVRVFSEARMGNHYHLVVQTPRANLPWFMRDLNRDFSKYSNRRHGRIGHLFNEPYQPILIDNDFYLRVATGYVVMNPVSHGFVEAPEAWKWSSYRATVGLEPPPDYLCLDWLDAAFPAASRELSQARFAEYLTARTWIEGEALLAKPLVGSTEFEREMREHIGATLFMAALPASYRAVGRPPLTELFPDGMSKDERNQQMLRAHVVYAYPMSEIARALCLHPGSVSRIIVKLRKKSRAA